MISQIDGDLALLRGLVARELDTINAYRRLAAESDDPALVEFFLHVVAEEKFHIADALRAIALLDPDQADLLQTGFAADHGPGDVPEPRADLASGVAGSSVHLGYAGVATSPSVLEEPGLPQSRYPGTYMISEVSGNSAGRRVSDSTSTGSGTNERERSASDRTDTSESSRVRFANSWTVGSLRRVPQSE